MSHTPGKWRLATPEEDEDDGFAGSVVSDDGGSVWFVAAICRGLPPEQEEANARLIAAAPDLLKALELVLSRALSLDPFTEQQARAAIRKARGEG